MSKYSDNPISANSSENTISWQCDKSIFLEIWLLINAIPELIEEQITDEIIEPSDCEEPSEFLDSLLPVWANCRVSSSSLFSFVSSPIATAYASSSIPWAS